MAEKLTPQQEAAIMNRGGKLLVSAAAGSGKTKVLVDRLLSYITDPDDPANVDDFLIITFTKAAAAELRVKIAQKLSERIAQEPENRHLQKQMQRLYLSEISTVDSFCANILRENAYRLDLPADFRVIEDKDSVQLKNEAIDSVLNTAYEHIHENKHIRDFLDTQGLGRNDMQIPSILLKVYDAASCHVDPDAWLTWCEEQADAKGITDVSETVWGAYLISDFHNMLDMNITALTNCLQAAEKNGEMKSAVQLLSDTIAQFQKYRTLRTWNEIHHAPVFAYGTLSFSKNCTDLKLRDQIKIIRETARDELVAKLASFTDPNDSVLQNLRESASSVKGLIKLVRQFGAEYDRLKKRWRALDFSDIEHKTLDLLYGKARTGITNAAKEIGARFREVMVDEYQDSNAVQDAIYEALTAERQNCFMVGDVKQSIYQFRLANPAIFIDKYDRYAHAKDAAAGQGRKIILSKNFRSGAGVINAVNDVFSEMMSTEVGGLNYTEDEMLYEGIPHVPLNEPEVEFYAVDAEESYQEEEAAFVAERISQLIDGTHMVRDGDALRPITTDDIVILLRSPKTSGGYFCYALAKRGIDCVMDGGDDLRQTEEIATIISLLQVLQNPQLDIPLIAVMCSRVFGFTADELAKIRAGNRYISMYDTLKRNRTDKVKNFLSVIDGLRNDAKIYTLSELLSRVLEQTKLEYVFYAMPDGEERFENIRTFFQIVSDFSNGGQKDLVQLLEFLENPGNKGLTVKKDMNPSGAVRIMTIHASKGLEYPVVFLSALSKQNNEEDLRKPVLCHKEYGIGLNFTNTKLRARIPTVAKNAIVVRMKADAISEELRVLYVAMTRARDRLIMTYGDRKLEQELTKVGLRMEMTPRVHMNRQADCIGRWILQTALGKTEAGELHALSGNLSFSKDSKTPWFIRVVKAPTDKTAGLVDGSRKTSLPKDVISRIAAGLQFEYPYTAATVVPSKQTATQLKGRAKDDEAAENTSHRCKTSFRKPSFIEQRKSAAAIGTAVHRFMQYAHFGECVDLNGIQNELKRMTDANLLTSEQADMVDCEKLLPFFTSELGRELCEEENKILREFKFSLLVDAKQYFDDVADEKILLQGVVDCALIRDDGIVVVDFKTDRVTEDTVDLVADRYRLQVDTYAKALERIYGLPVKETYLYLFHVEKFIKV